MKKIKGTRIETIDGVRCAVLATSGGDVALPAAGLLAVLELLVRQLSGPEMEQKAEFLRVRPIRAETLQAQPLEPKDGRTVVLSINPRLPNGASYALSVAQCAELAPLLLDAAREAGAARPLQN